MSWSECCGFAMGSFAACQRHMMVQYSGGSGLTCFRRFLTSASTVTLVSAFALLRIDYCNSLLFGSTHDATSNLQRIQNYSARIILRLPKSSNITTHLK